MRPLAPGAAAVWLAVLAGIGCASAGSGELPARGAPGAAALQPLPEGVQAISMLGDTLREPALSAAARTRYEARLAEATRAAERAPADADSLIWLGRRLGYLGRFRDAIRTFDRAIELHADDPRLYRHRGHRFITVRRPDLAIQDLEHAARLMRGAPDASEPDGLPNARNVPLSTLHFNVWYHLGLARFVRGELEEAARAYREAMRVSKNPDTRVATAHWHYLALRRLGRGDEARALLTEFVPGMDVVEDSAYYRLVLMYRGLIAADSLVDPSSSAPITDVALGYGVGSWHFVEGRRDLAVSIWRRVLASGQWPAFGFIAAEADLHRQGVREPVPVAARPAAGVPAPAATVAPALGTDIFLIRLERDGAGYRGAGEPVNVSAHAGYDNQPHFEPDRASLLFTSARDGDTDIYRHDIATGATTALTRTAENEYSPTVTPDRRGFTVIRGAQQYLERFDRDGKDPTVVLRNITPVGYHAWGDDSTLVLFVLGDPITLQRANARTGAADTIFTSPGRSLHRIPGRHAVSAVQRRGEDDYWIVAYDLDSRRVDPIVPAVPGSSDRDYAWTPDGTIVMTAGNSIYQLTPGRDREWKLLAKFESPAMQKLTRIAVSPGGDYIAVVADEAP